MTHPYRTPGLRPEYPPEEPRRGVARSITLDADYDRDAVVRSIREPTATERESIMSILAAYRVKDTAISRVPAELYSKLITFPSFARLGIFLANGNMKFLGIEIEVVPRGLGAL